LKIREIEMDVGDELRVTFRGLWPTCDVKLALSSETRTVRISSGENTPDEVHVMKFSSPIPPQ
jgi:hypothetical protein